MDVNGLDIPSQNEADHREKSKRAAAATSKTEKMREKIKQLRKNFKLLDQTKPKGKRGEKCKRKKKGNKRSKKKNSCRRKRKKSKGGKRMKKKTRYYMENGKYKQNKKFESWADEVTKMWKKVNIPQFKVTETSCNTL